MNSILQAANLLHQNPVMALARFLTYPWTFVSKISIHLMILVALHSTLYRNFFHIFTVLSSWLCSRKNLRKFVHYAPDVGLISSSVTFLPGDVIFYKHQNQMVLFVRKKSWQSRQLVLYIGAA